LEYEREKKILDHELKMKQHTLLSFEDEIQKLKDEPKFGRSTSQIDRFVRSNSVYKKTLNDFASKSEEYKRNLE